MINVNNIRFTPEELQLAHFLFRRSVDTPSKENDVHFVTFGEFLTTVLEITCEGFERRILKI